MVGKYEKTVSIYLGVGDNHIWTLLALVCQRLKMTKAEFIRWLIRDKLRDWKLLDGKDQMVQAQVDLLREELEHPSNYLPKFLVEANMANSMRETVAEVRKNRMDGTEKASTFVQGDVANGEVREVVQEETDEEPPAKE